MIPWLEDPVVDIGSHHLIGVRLMQDGGSLIGLTVVLGLVGYGLRRGREQAVHARILRPAERRVWVLTYLVAAVALSVAWFVWARLGEPTGHSLKALANGIAVAALRGLAMALLYTSLALSGRLRALRVASARRSP
jgi:hypothetical protein